MIVSYNWLNNYLKIPVDLNTTSDALTSIGLEVESIKEIFSSFDHLVIGKILECYQHPNADRLKITKVDIGKEIKQIVCGANNVKKGQLVVVVLEGKELKTKKGEVFKNQNTLGGMGRRQRAMPSRVRPPQGATTARRPPARRGHHPTPPHPDSKPATAPYRRPRARIARNYCDRCYLWLLLFPLLAFTALSLTRCKYAQQA